MAKRNKKPIFTSFQDDKLKNNIAQNHQQYNHLVFSCNFNENGAFVPLSFDKAADELKSKNLSWVHLDASEANILATRDWLNKEVNYLDHLIIDALLATEARSRIMEFETGLLMILRGVNLSNNANREDMVSIRIWVDECRIITIQRREMRSIFDFRQMLENGKHIKNSGEFLYNLLYQILSEISSFLLELSDQVDNLEDLINQKKIQKIPQKEIQNNLLQLRTKLAIFKRYLIPQKELIAKLRICEIDFIDEWSRRHFQENYDYITRMIEEAEESRERTQIINDEIANAINAKVGKNMYKLSIITMIFMPLTFITGLLGMNVGGIPGADNPTAFTICAIMMFIIAILQIIILKKRDWF
jgi:zinc transporter